MNYTKFNLLKLYRSFVYASKGIVNLLKTEQNARIHLIYTINHILHMGRIGAPKRLYLWRFFLRRESNLVAIDININRTGKGARELSERPLHRHKIAIFNDLCIFRYNHYLFSYSTHMFLGTRR